MSHYPPADQPPHGFGPPPGPGDPYGSGNPYGQPQQPQQPPQQSPQQSPQQMPQQAPQQPYQGYGYPPNQPAAYPGWGTPAPPQPPRRRTGLIVGGVVAGLVVVAGAAFGISQAVGGGGGGGGSDESLKLTTPQTLRNGTYTLDKDTEELAKQGLSAQQSMPAGLTSVAATYKKGGSTTDQLVISGGYGGHMKHPDNVVNDIFKGMEQTPSVSVEKARQDYHPNGTDGLKVSCEVIKMQLVYYVPACGWADGSTAALVMELNQSWSSAGDVDTESFASTVAGIHDDMTEPAK
jgi:hypothetical protein